MRNFANASSVVALVAACSSDSADRTPTSADLGVVSGVENAQPVNGAAPIGVDSSGGTPAPTTGAGPTTILITPSEMPAAPTPGVVAEGEACQSVSERGMPRLLPQDIVLVIDNSGSMDGEAQAVQDRINVDLAQILEQSGIDFRVILLSRYGKVGDEIGSIETGICIGAPLGGHDCSDPDAIDGDTPGTQPLMNTDRFFHYSEDIDSTDALCQIISRFTSSEHADDHPGITSDGWQQFARPEAFKSFVVITDDQVDCDVDDVDLNDGNTEAGAVAAAADFDRALLALSPEQFGTADERNYNFYSIVGVQENDPATVPWSPTDPISEEECSANNNNVEEAGTGYQALSVLTGGLRYPICENGNFDAIFRAIAEGILRGAALSCEYDIPTPPAGEVLDPNRVNLQFQPDVGDNVPFFRTPSAADCGDAGGWYYDDPTAPTRVLVCPTTCDFLQTATGSVEVQFGCESKFVPPAVR